MLKIKNILLGFYISAFSILFGWLLWTHMLMPKSDGWYSGGSTWGDLAIHLDYINGFSQRGLQIIFDNPIFAGEKMAYPFMPDLVTSLLARVMPLNFALILPTLFLATLSVYLMVKLSKSLLTPILFFFNGSLFGLYYYFLDKVTLTTMEKEYAHLADFNIRFSNIIVDYVLPQRTFIWGLVLGLIAIIFLWKQKYYRYAIIVGILPIFHTHTFLTFVMVSIIYFILHPSKKLMYAGMLMAIIAIPQFPLILKTGHEGFIRWQLGWMADKENFFWFWFKNLPVQILLIIPAFIAAERKMKKFSIPFLSTFVICNLFQFQPHNYDNMKIMIWGFLFMCILIAHWLTKIPKFFVPALLFSLLVTGFLSVYRETYVSWRMFSPEDIALSEFIKNNTDPNALFLTSDRHNNPVNCLAGRKVFLGFKGWLWTHGINYVPRERIVNEIYQGDPRSSLQITSQKIDYILLEKDKYKDLNINENYFLENYDLVYDSANYLLFNAHEQI